MGIYTGFCLHQKNGCCSRYRTCIPPSFYPLIHSPCLIFFLAAFAFPIDFGVHRTYPRISNTYPLQILCSPISPHPVCMHVTNQMWFPRGHRIYLPPQQFFTLTFLCTYSTSIRFPMFSYQCSPTSQNDTCASQIFFLFSQKITE